MTVVTGEQTVPVCALGVRITLVSGMVSVTWKPVYASVIPTGKETKTALHAHPAGKVYRALSL